MVYILAAILVFGVLIAVHELGHFMAAKAHPVEEAEGGDAVLPAAVSGGRFLCHGRRRGGFR